MARRSSRTPKTRVDLSVGCLDGDDSGSGDDNFVPAGDEQAQAGDTARTEQASVVLTLPDAGSPSNAPATIYTARRGPRSGAASAEKAAWVISSTGPTFARTATRILTPLLWPCDGLPKSIALRSTTEEGALTATRNEARRLGLAAVPEQTRELIDLGWYPGKVDDPRVERLLVLEADDRAAAISSSRRIQEHGGPKAFSDTPFQLPFRHPNLEQYQCEVVAQGSAQARQEFRLSLETSATASSSTPPTKPTASDVSRTDVVQRHDSEDSSAFSTMSVAEKHVATFQEVPPHNDAEHGGVKLFAGVPEPKYEHALPTFANFGIEGSGHRQLKEKIHLLNVGGTVYDLAWRPVPNVLAYGPEFLAVSAAQDIDTRTSITTTCQEGTAGIIQVWSLRPAPRPSNSTSTLAHDGPESRAGQSAGQKGVNADCDSSVSLAMLVHHDYGPALKMEWCPAGHDFRSKPCDLKGRPPRRLGLLAGVFMDGTIRILSLPHPEDLRIAEGMVSGSAAGPLHIKVVAPLTLQSFGAVPTCLSWAGGELLAAGFSDGHVGVWRTGDALRSGASTARPSHFIPFDDSHILSVAWALAPVQTASDTFKAATHSLPHVLAVTNIGGAYALLDLHDPLMAWNGENQRSRWYLHKVIWLPQLELFAFESADGSLRLLRHRYVQYGVTKRISATDGRVLSLAASGHHPFLAFGSTDGSLRVINAMRGITRMRSGGLSRPTIKVYRLDHDRSTGRLRMLDDFLPEFLNAMLHEDNPRAQKKAKAGNSALPPAFHPAVAVRSAEWNPNLGRSHILASGTGIGVVRVESFDLGSVRMSGRELPAERLETRRARSRLGQASLGQLESGRPIAFEDLGEDANVTVPVALDDIIEVEAEEDGEHEYLAHLRTFHGATEPVRTKDKQPRSKATKDPDAPPKKRGRPRKHPLPETKSQPRPAQRPAPETIVTPAASDHDSSDSDLTPLSDD